MLRPKARQRLRRTADHLLGGCRPVASALPPIFAIRVDFGAGAVNQWHRLFVRRDAQPFPRRCLKSMLRACVLAIRILAGRVHGGRCPVKSFQSRRTVIVRRPSQAGGAPIPPSHILAGPAESLWQQMARVDRCEYQAPARARAVSPKAISQDALTGKSRSAAIVGPEPYEFTTARYLSSASEGRHLREDDACPIR